MVTGYALLTSQKTALPCGGVYGKQPSFRFAWNIVRNIAGMRLFTAGGLQILKPLMLNNLSEALENGVENALTGPIERGDVATVAKHLEVLDSERKDIYKALGKQILNIAERKIITNRAFRNIRKLKRSCKSENTVITFKQSKAEGKK